MSPTLSLLPAPYGVGRPSQLEAPIRVVLADDHAMVRRTLRLVLESEQDVDVIAEAVDLGAVMRDVGRHVPHVLVLDLQLPSGSSIGNDPATARAVLAYGSGGADHGGEPTVPRSMRSMPARSGSSRRSR